MWSSEYPRRCVQGFHFQYTYYFVCEFTGAVLRGPLNKVTSEDFGTSEAPFKGSVCSFKDRLSAPPFFLCRLLVAALTSVR